MGKPPLHTFIVGGAAKSIQSCRVRRIGPIYNNLVKLNINQGDKTI